jgi:hypothetical protein
MIPSGKIKKLRVLVPDAVAGLLKINEVVFRLDIIVLAGIPLPVTKLPTINPAVEETDTEVLPEDLVQERLIYPFCIYAPDG